MWTNPAYIPSVSLTITFYRQFISPYFYIPSILPTGIAAVQLEACIFQFPTSKFQPNQQHHHCCGPDNDTSETTITSANQIPVECGLGIAKAVNNFLLASAGLLFPSQLARCRHRLQLPVRLYIYWHDSRFYSWMAESCPTIYIYILRCHFDAAHLHIIISPKARNSVLSLFDFPQSSSL